MPVWILCDYIWRDVNDVLVLGEISKQWRNPWWQVHRVDVHRELKRVLVDCCGGETSNAPELILGAIVEDIDVDAGKVTLVDGRIFTSDVIIGADGNASFCRLQIDPHAKLKRWEKVCFRFLVPKQVLLDDPETSDLVHEDSWFSEVSEADRRIILYGCRNNTMINVGAFIPNAEASLAGHGMYQDTCVDCTIIGADLASRYRLEPTRRKRDDTQGVRELVSRRKEAPILCTRRSESLATV